MKAKPEPPPVVEHECLVIRVYRRDNGNWFATVANNAIRQFETIDYALKSHALLSACSGLLINTGLTNEKTAAPDTGVQAAG